MHGEEFGAEPGTSGRTWVLDPIDGTTAFMAGRPIFGTLIALVVEGWPVLGVIDQPILGERWLGVTGQPTTFSGTLGSYEFAMGDTISGMEPIAGNTLAVATLSTVRGLIGTPSAGSARIAVPRLSGWTGKRL